TPFTSHGGRFAIVTERRHGALMVAEVDGLDAWRDAHVDQRDVPGGITLLDRRGTRFLATRHGVRGTFFIAWQPGHAAFRPVWRAGVDAPDALIMADVALLFDVLDCRVHIARRADGVVVADLPHFLPVRSPVRLTATDFLLTRPGLAMHRVVFDCGLA